MKKYKNYTVEEYLSVLSRKLPVPGGGSAAALVAASGAALLSMVANYSVGKGKSQKIENKIAGILKKSEQIRKQFIELIDSDVQAYLGVIKARGASAQVKKTALRRAAQVPREVCVLCYQAIQLAPYLVENGNQNLISDIVVAVEMFQAAFYSARVNVEINS